MDKQNSSQENLLGNVDDNETTSRGSTEKLKGQEERGKSINFCLNIKIIDQSDPQT